MTDKQLMDFIEKNGIQIWPQRKAKHGPIVWWWTQNVSPFMQTNATTVREALTKLKRALDQ